MRFCMTCGWPDESIDLRGRNLGTNIPRVPGQKVARSAIGVVRVGRASGGRTRGELVLSVGIASLLHVGMAPRRTSLLGHGPIWRGRIGLAVLSAVGTAAPTTASATAATAWAFISIAVAAVAAAAPTE